MPYQQSLFDSSGPSAFADAVGKIGTAIDTVISKISTLGTSSSSVFSGLQAQMGSLAPATSSGWSVGNSVKMGGLGGMSGNALSVGGNGTNTPSRPMAIGGNGGIGAGGGGWRGGGGWGGSGDTNGGNWQDSGRGTGAGGPNIPTAPGGPPQMGWGDNAGTRALEALPTAAGDYIDRAMGGRSNVEQQDVWANLAAQLSPSGWSSGAQSNFSTIPKGTYATSLGDFASAQFQTVSSLGVIPTNMGPNSKMLGSQANAFMTMLPGTSRSAATGLMGSFASGSFLNSLQSIGISPQTVRAGGQYQNLGNLFQQVLSRGMGGRSLAQIGGPNNFASIFQGTIAPQLQQAGWSADQIQALSQYGLQQSAYATSHNGQLADNGQISQAAETAMGQGHTMVQAGLQRTSAKVSTQSDLVSGYSKAAQTMDHASTTFNNAVNNFIKAVPGLGTGLGILGSVGGTVGGMFSGLMGGMLGGGLIHTLGDVGMAAGIRSMFKRGAGTATRTAGRVAADDGIIDMTMGADGVYTAAGTGLGAAGLGVGLGTAGMMLAGIPAMAGVAYGGYKATQLASSGLRGRGAGSWLKAIGGGAASGAAIGSFLPGIGTVVGGTIGGLVGLGGKTIQAAPHLLNAAISGGKDILHAGEHVGGSLVHGAESVGSSIWHGLFGGGGHKSTTSTTSHTSSADNSAKTQASAASVMHDAAVKFQQGVAAFNPGGRFGSSIGSVAGVGMVAASSSSSSSSPMSSGSIGSTIQNAGIFAGSALSAIGTLFNTNVGGTIGSTSLISAISGSGTTSGNINSPTAFATALLNALGAPLTNANVQSIVAWENREGGNWHNNAKYNPLNTTLNEPGASSINSVGVRAYTSWNQGIQATLSTLNSGYSDIVSALKSGQGLGSKPLAGLSKWSGGAYSEISYAKGSWDVPQTGSALLHKGERVIPASENYSMAGRYTRAAQGDGTGGNNFGDIYVQLPTGWVGTQADADNAASAVITAIQKKTTDNGTRNN